MITGELKNKIDRLWETFWTGGITNPLDVVEQMTYLMFIHDLDATDNQRAKELFVPIYRFCKSTGQNGRILPNSILRPAIELVTGIHLGPARSPLAPATEEEMAVTTAILREIGKLN